jgi:hypothetical protein
MLDYATHHNLNHDHRLIKAIMMNSGVKALDANGAPWSNSATVPLDNQQGTGILNLPRVYAMYAAGQQRTGPVAVPGFDFTTITGTNAPNPTLPGWTNGLVSYRLGSPVTTNADLDVTLAWDRHTYWSDLNNNKIIDAADTFYTLTNDAQAKLTLALYNNGVAVTSSQSSVDNVQHLHLTGLKPGAYELKVQHQPVLNSSGNEPYGLAWYSSVAWTNLAPQVKFQKASLGAGNLATLQFQLTAGQAGNFQLLSATNLVAPISWVAVTNATLSQSSSNMFALQTTLSAGRAQFFRLVATP